MPAIMISRRATSIGMPPRRPCSTIASGGIHALPQPLLATGGPASGESMPAEPAAPVPPVPPTPAMAAPAEPP
jgi:hypothetical protein